MPAQGKAVEIKARARGAAAWTTVTRLRTDSHGRFRFAYRFRRTFTTTTYEFRGVAPRESAYPYLRGWSRVRRVTVESVVATDQRTPRSSSQLCTAGGGLR